MNHNQPKLTHSQQQHLKPKKSSQDKPAEVKELEKLTITELDAIAGTGIELNHNENMVKFPHLSKKQKTSSEGKSAKVKELQKLTLLELNAIAGAGLKLQHNETVVSFSKQSQKQKTSSESKSAEVKKLQKLSILELEAISGGELGVNHNENMVKSPNLSQKPKPSNDSNHNLRSLNEDELALIWGGTRRGIPGPPGGIISGDTSTNGFSIVSFDL